MNPSRRPGNISAESCARSLDDSLRGHQRIRPRGHRSPAFRGIAKRILAGIEDGEEAATSTLVLCDVAWVLEAMGKRGMVRSVLGKIL
jgi:hypothetical protein